MFVRASKFRHVFGKETKLDDCFNGIKFDCVGDTGLAVNGKWVAVVQRGKIYVLPCDNPDRYDNNTSFIDSCTSKIEDVAWNPFNADMLACCSEDASIKLYEIPEGGICDLEENMTECLASASDPHERKVTNIYWHPSAADIIASISHCPKVVIWNYTASKELVPVCEIDDNILGDIPFALAWNYNGSKIGVVSKDKALRLICPRSGEVIEENPECHEGTRGTKIAFLRDDRIITCGSNKKSERQMKLWSAEPGKLDEPIFELDLGQASGILMPVVDYQLDLVYTFSKGEGQIKYYEIGEKEIFFLNQYSSNVSQRGGNFVPKHTVNVNQQEIARFYKVHTNKDRIEPIQLIVPRKNEKKFQSDLYPDCPGPEAAITGAEWLEGTNSDPATIDLSSGQIVAAKNVAQQSRVQMQHKKRAVAEPSAPMPSAGATYTHNKPTDNGIPPGIDLKELWEDMKKVKATVRRMNRRVTQLEKQLGEVVDGDNDDQQEEEEE